MIFGMAIFLALRAPPANKISSFLKSKMVAAAILKIE